MMMMMQQMLIAWSSSRLKLCTCSSTLRVKGIFARLHSSSRTMASSSGNLAQPQPGSPEPIYGVECVGDWGSLGLAPAEKDAARPRRGRPPLCELVQRPGPNIAVLLFGAPEGRWRAELTARTPASKAASTALRCALGNEDTGMDAVGMGSLGTHVVGVAVMEGWRFPRGPATSWGSFHLMASSCAFHKKRCTPHFLEHPVVCAAALQGSPVWFSGPWSMSCQQPTLVATPPDLLQALMSRNFLITRAAPGHPSVHQIMVLGDLLQFWRSSVGFTGPVRPWASWTPLAKALAQGAWGGDITPVFKRALHCTALPVVSPTRKQIQLFKSTPATEPAEPLSAIASADQVHAPTKGFVKPYTAGHMLRALQFGQSQSNQRLFSSTAVAALQWWYPPRLGKPLGTVQRSRVSCTPQENLARIQDSS